MERTIVLELSGHNGPKRYGDLVALSDDISKRVLIQVPRRLESYGLVTRIVLAEAPPCVEYSLTKVGETPQEPIAALTTWATEHGEALDAVLA